MSRAGDPPPCGGALCVDSADDVGDIPKRAVETDDVESDSVFPLGDLRWKGERRGPLNEMDLPVSRKCFLPLERNPLKYLADRGDVGSSFVSLIHGGSSSSTHACTNSSHVVWPVPDPPRLAFIQKCLWYVNP